MAKTKSNKAADRSLYYLAAARIGLGFIFLWSFFDKLFGLGFSTCKDAVSGAVDTMCSKAWLAGGSPTEGFLQFGTQGPLAEFYQGMAGSPAIDVLFMAGLGLIGLALILGIGVKVATVSGSLMMLMMWSAALLPANNPILDEHIIYVIVLLGILAANKDQKWGLGKAWAKHPAVKRLPILE